MANVWIYSELNEGGPASIALELLTRARDLGEVEAVALGPGAGSAAEVIEVPASVGEGSRRARIAERRVEAGDKIKLEDARVVVSGGRGLGGPENFHFVEELADALGGAAGASRAIVDAGWVPY